MQITLEKARKLSLNFVLSLGFDDTEAQIITDNVMEAEIAGHLTHGLGNLLWFKTALNQGVGNTRINQSGEPVKILKETPVSLYVDGRNRSGYVVIREALDLALKKVTQSYIVATGLTNTAPSTGYLGHYARLATEQKLIMLLWNTSPGRVAPFGSVSRLWGTNPYTVGIPTGNQPVILDMATSAITVGQMLKNQREGKPLPPDSAIDKEGKVTTDPQIAWDEGSLLPIGGYKGSGLSMLNELLAGALTASKVGFAVPGGWGTFFLLINPTIFRSYAEFTHDVDAGIKELKSSQKRVGVTDIFYPGEQSQTRRLENLKKGTLEVDDQLLQSLQV
jgi:L-2-hydroxycarboxylate dehydrogenase (NAD+)